MSGLIYQWIDLIWLPIGWFAAHKRHRWLMMVFLLTCSLTMRTQVELLDSIDADRGLLPIMHTSIYSRGLIVYSIVIAIFLVLAHYSPGTSRMVFFAASLTIFIFTFCLSLGVMLL